MASYDIKKWIAEHPKEERYKHQFLDKNPSKVLSDTGIRAGKVVLDFGCGAGIYTVPAAKLVERDSRGGEVIYKITKQGRIVYRLE